MDVISKLSSASGPSFLAILSKLAGSQYQGAVQGFASSAGSLASIVGLVAGGIVYGLIGVHTFVIPGVLLLVILVIGLLISGPIQRARQQRSAVTTIVAKGGHVYYDHEWDGEPVPVFSFGQMYRKLTGREWSRKVADPPGLGPGWP